MLNNAALNQRSSAFVPNVARTQNSLRHVNILSENRAQFATPQSPFTNVGMIAKVHQFSSKIQIPGSTTQGLPIQNAIRQAPQRKIQMMTRQIYKSRPMIESSFSFQKVFVAGPVEKQQLHGIQVIGRQSRSNGILEQFINSDLHRQKRVKKENTISIFQQKLYFFDHQKDIYGPQMIIKDEAVLRDMLKQKKIYLVNKEIVEMVLRGPDIYNRVMANILKGQDVTKVESVVMNWMSFLKVYVQTEKEIQATKQIENRSLESPRQKVARHEKTLILISGTSGTGKTTIANSVAERLDSNIIPLSTDSIRHILRHRTSVIKTPLLFSSTYQTSLKNYLNQCDLIHEHLTPIIENWIENEEGHKHLVIEGVHLTPEYVRSLKNTLVGQISVIDVMVKMENADVHYQRLSERGADKYLKNFDRIASIQDYLTTYTIPTSIVLNDILDNATNTVMKRIDQEKWCEEKAQQVAQEVDLPDINNKMDYDFSSIDESFMDIVAEEGLIEQDLQLVDA